MFNGFSCHDTSGRIIATPRSTPPPNALAHSRFVKDWGDTTVSLAGVDTAGVVVTLFFELRPVANASHFSHSRTHGIVKDLPTTTSGLYFVLFMYTSANSPMH